MIKAIFKTSGSGYKEIDAHNGETVWILRQLIDGEEVDICEVGRMYKCKCADGFIFDAFEDELIF